MVVALVAVVAMVVPLLAKVVEDMVEAQVLKLKVNYNY